MTILGKVGKWQCSLPAVSPGMLWGGICPSEMDDAILLQHSLWRILGCEGPGPVAQDGVWRNWLPDQGYDMIPGFQSPTLRSHLLHDGSFGSFLPCPGVSRQASPRYGAGTRRPGPLTVVLYHCCPRAKGQTACIFCSPGSRAPSRIGCCGLSCILPPLFYISVHFVEDYTGQNASTL